MIGFLGFCTDARATTGVTLGSFVVMEVPRTTLHCMGIQRFS